MSGAPAPEPLGWKQENPKKLRKSSKIDSFIVAMVTKIVFFNIFLLIMIGIDYTVIMMYYMPYYMLPLMYGSSKTFKNDQKWPKRLTLATLTVSMATKRIFPGKWMVPQCRPTL